MDESKEKSSDFDEDNMTPLIANKDSLTNPKPLNQIVRGIENVQELNKNGYATVDKFIDDENTFVLLTQLANEYLSKTNLPGPIKVTFQEDNKLLRKQFSEKIQNILENALWKYFVDFKIIQASFIIKEKQADNSAIYPLQDWTFVDEENGEESFTLWFGLEDITPDMGGMAFIDKSHKIANCIRHSPDSKYRGNNIVDYSLENGHKQFIELKKGQALLWNNKTLHFSNPNLSNKNRIAVAFGLTHIDNQLRLNWKSPLSGLIEQYDVLDDFYYSHNSFTLEHAYAKGLHPLNDPSKKSLNYYSNVLVVDKEAVNQILKLRFKKITEENKEHIAKFFASFDEQREIESNNNQFNEHLLLLNILNVISSSKDLKIYPKVILFLKEIVDIQSSGFKSCNSFLKELNDIFLASEVLQSIDQSYNSSSILKDYIQKEKYKLRPRKKYLLSIIKNLTGNYFDLVNQLLQDSELKPALFPALYVGLENNPQSEKLALACFEDWRSMGNPSSLNNNCLNAKLFQAYHISKLSKNNQQSSKLFSTLNNSFIKEYIEYFNLLELLLAYFSLNHLNSKETTLEKVKQKIHYYVLTNNDNFDLGTNNSLKVLEAILLEEFLACMKTNE